MSPAARVNIERQVRGSAPIFAALGDATRLRIVSRLAAGEPLSIAALTAGTGVTRQAVTKHLRVLDHAGLVRGQRRGRERIWELDPAQLEAARRTLEVISTQWNDALGNLKSFIEQPEKPLFRRDTELRRKRWDSLRDSRK